MDNPTPKNVSIIADSLNIETGDRMTTFILHRFPYTLIQEPATHRMLRWSSHCVSGDLNPFGETVSRNSASTRAIPIKTIIDRIRQDPFIPTWTGAKKGMQGDFDSLTDEIERIAEESHLRSMEFEISQALVMDQIGIHKQHANDLLKPFMRIPVLVSGTEWDNFFELRCNKETVRPELWEVACEMRDLRQQNKPNELRPGEWHIPFGDRIEGNLDRALKIATARAARISYATHDGDIDTAKDVALHDRLLKDRHASPFEHSAMATDVEYKNLPHWHLIDGSKDGKAFWHEPSHTRNYRGFYSYRAMLEDGLKPCAVATVNLA